MAEPLKAIYDEAFLKQFGERVRRRHAGFDAAGFVRLVLGEGWERLELKGRIRRITDSLGEKLPQRYEEALDVLEGIADDCRGFPYLFFPDFVERFGLDDWERSMRALAKFTALSSAEFAVRPFIKRDTPRMMAQMQAWSLDADEHVRRLASEGCRPRLPWADALPAFKRDPSPILPILEALKADPSEYVRRSVANNLNDISKDHPALVLELAKRWFGRQPETDALLRHACRSLIRQSADPEALALFGLAPLSGIEVTAWSASPSEVSIGGAAEIQYALRMPEGAGAKLRLELAVYYPRPSGKAYRKLFKLSERVAAGGEQVSGARRHAFADLSTRRHHPGAHRLVLVVNGQPLAETEIRLTGEGAESP
ncbi:DNA alkylation repair protein [Cohnella nanjingensis]|uniref:DNA alkylation repair protein n=1 Tax=Cohnella nanjingensis TaxID=1387779 RepID=A0A7X0RVQ5_9BACL|nr:DNA alkylation repair protein [Cohnella nanjingensis]MBB6674480.1 DNA alkylation repair protein [Cohnella nanjingensis]